MSVRTVVVAHREAMVAEGIASALSRYPEIVPVGVATSVAEASARAARADAVALDLSLPGAVEAAADLQRRGIRVVFLADGESEEDEGIRVSTASSVAALAAALVPGAGELRQTPHILTTREREILTLVAQGMAGKQVARHLGISPKTVEHHKTRIFAKLRVPNQAAAVSFAMSDGLPRSRSWNLSSI